MPPASIGRILSAAVAVALTCGVLFGFLDAVIADVHLRPPRGFLGYLGCYAGAIMSYCGLYLVLLLPASLLFFPAMRLRPLRRLLLLGLTAGIFAEVYWWSRPFVFYGHSSVSPERLGALGVQVLLAFALAWIAAKAILHIPRPVHIAIRGLAFVSILGGMLFISAEQALVMGRGTLNERNKDLPNVLLVIVDALRADHLGCYGNDRIKTPHMDALADRGVLFENCFAQAPYTLTSFGSILTGKYPRRHGLVAQKPGVQMKPNITLPVHLKSAKIAGKDDHLRDEDYDTATFMTGAVSHGSGLARGFDAYSEAMMGHDLVQLDSQWSAFRSELLLFLFKNKLTQRVDSDIVVNTASTWLEKRKGRRWMAMVHLYSTHTPYDPPHHFQQPYLDPTYDGKIRSFYAGDREALERGEYVPNDGDVQQIRDLYAAGTAQADAQIGRLMKEIEELGMLSSTLVILTSDHGEDLGEWRPVGPKGATQDARFWEHNHMWQTNLRVPMILANTRLLPHGLRVDDMIESVDLMPTLCELMGLEWPKELKLQDGSNEEKYVQEIDGESLVGRLLGTQRGESSTYTPKKFSFSENNHFLSIQSPEAKLIVPRQLLSKADSSALHDTSQWVRFYDLVEHPEEENNGLSKQEARVQALWDELLKYDKSMPEPEMITTERDVDFAEMLKKLGYAGGIDAFEPEPEAPAPPVDESKTSPDKSPESVSPKNAEE